MATYRELDPDRLSYDPETGEFRWLDGNRRGEIAGSINKDGYREIRVPPHRHVLLHHIAWFKMTGQWPTHIVDHSNRVRDDNRWVNLRSLTQVENLQNCSPRLGTKTPGAGWCISRQKWRARIKIMKREVHLGYFDSAEAASKAYLDAKARHHPSWTL